MTPRCLLEQPPPGFEPGNLQHIMSAHYHNAIEGVVYQLTSNLSLKLVEDRRIELLCSESKSDALPLC